MILISAALFLGGFVFLLNRRARSISSMSEFEKCTHLVSSLKNILVQIQKHRGLTTAYLNGDEDEFRSEIEDKKRLTDRMWISLVSECPSLIEDQLYWGIMDHWERLKKRWPSRSVDNNIEQHNRLILNLILLIESQEEGSILFADMLRKQGLDLSWKALLEIIEILGQVRAVGAGIVSSGRSTVLERNKIFFLVERTESHLTKISDSFRRSSSLDDSDEIKYHLLLSTNNTRLLCDLVIEKFEKPRVQHLSTNQFFDHASTAIESFSVLFDCVILVLQREALLSSSWPVFIRDVVQNPRSI